MSSNFQLTFNDEDNQDFVPIKPTRKKMGRIFDDDEDDADDNVNSDKFDNERNVNDEDEDSYWYQSNQSNRRNLFEEANQSNSNRINALKSSGNKMSEGNASKSESNGSLSKRNVLNSSPRDSLLVNNSKGNTFYLEYL